MKEVDLYKMKGIAIYANDTDPNTDIKKMLEECSKITPDNFLILCAGFDQPMLLEYRDKIHVFYPLDESLDEVLKKVPKDSIWSKLIGKKTITVSPEEITKLASEKGYSPRLAAKRILEGYLKQHEKDIAIFYNDSGKLVAFVLYGPNGPQAFVEKNSFLYSKSKGTILGFKKDQTQTQN